MVHLMAWNKVLRVSWLHQEKLTKCLGLLLKPEPPPNDWVEGWEVREGGENMG